MKRRYILAHPWLTCSLLRTNSYVTSALKKIIIFQWKFPLQSSINGRRACNGKFTTPKPPPLLLATGRHNVHISIGTYCAHNDTPCTAPDLISHRR